MATILIVAKPLDDRKRDIWQIADSMRDELEAIPGVDVVISATAVSSMMGGMADISYVIKGDNLDELQKIGDDLQSIMESVPDTYEVTSTADSSKQELQLLVNRQKAQQYGLGVYQISQAVRAAFEGTVASKFREGGQEYDIKVMMPENLSKTTADLQSITVTGPTGVSVPLSAVAEIKVADGAVSVSRENGSRMITVSCQVLGSDLKGVAEQIQTKMDTELFLPDGYLIEQGGSLEEMLDVFSDLTLALLLAILLIYMVLAALYESFIDPFVVMFTLPPAIIGVLLFLAIFNKTLNISSFIGIIMLAGIVVNNGIVLVDYIKQQRKTGLTVREAVEKAGMVRVRPVLMTALTTILAMFPLCFSRGEGAEMTSPMAVAVVGGLIFATAFTLVFVPVIYTLINEIPDRRRDKKAKKRAKKAAEKEQKALNAANAAPIIEEEL
ncbi:MAG: efflux RND transporter permease subunit, partial [Clostridia bacterium]|nr:efflux RND transporter permease subunit [Clostridia bacterium]